MMDDRIRSFWKQHSELRLQGGFRIRDGTRIYGFMASDGVVVLVSIDNDRWRHISISKRTPPLFEATTMRPATEAEMSRYLDFFMGTDFVRCGNPVSTAILDFLEVGHPEM